MYIRKTSKKIGMSPGEIIYLGDKDVEDVKITVIEYSSDAFSEIEVPDVASCTPYKESDAVSWINITGVHKVDLIRELGVHFNLHPLVLEDIANTEQRPKMDDFEDYLFMVMKMVYPDMESHSIRYEQISFIIGRGYVISLQEVEKDVFDPVRTRIKKGKGRIRKKGSDYLAYALMDMVVDHYFKVLEEIGEEIEDLQDDVLKQPEPLSLKIIHNLKKEILFLRKSLWPLREIVNTLIRGESSLIGEETVVYLRDVYDHTIQVIETIETYRDILSSTLDIYLSNVSNRMNEVMKVLTIIATIFIPMTFIAGIYGMNFRYMPELEWKWSYPLLWLALIAVFGVMIGWFKHKKWF